MSTPPRRPPASKSAPAPASRRRREVLIALLALPVLLVLGLLAGNALTDNDTVDVAGGTPVGAAPTLTAPQVQGPTVASAQPTTEAPETTEAPAPTTPATTPPSATSEAPATTPPATETTTAPSSAPAPPTAASPPAEPDEAAAEAESDDGARAAPAPRAGQDAQFALGSVGADVKVWQARMVERGWVLGADGIFGPRTESVVRSFQAEKGLDVDGVLGSRTWTAAWTTPIT